MKKKNTKSSTKKSSSKSVTCASRVTPTKAAPKGINCASKVTPIKATLESEITPEIEVKKHKDPRLPAVGTVFIKRFKGKDLEIVVTAEGLKWEGKTYKSLSGLAVAITQYPISGYVFFQKELAEWH